MMMPFGRYRGLPLSEIPDAYLDWLFTIRLREPLASALNREAARRAGDFGGSNGAYSGPIRRMTELDSEIAGELVTAGYRVLAQRHHPDHGGETRIMQVINATVEALRQLLAATESVR